MKKSAAIVKLMKILDEEQYEGTCMLTDRVREVEEILERIENEIGMQPPIYCGKLKYAASHTERAEYEEVTEWEIE